MNFVISFHSFEFSFGIMSVNIYSFGDSFIHLFIITHWEKCSISIQRKKKEINKIQDIEITFNLKVPFKALKDAVHS